MQDAQIVVLHNTTFYLYIYLNLQFDVWEEHFEHFDRHYTAITASVCLILTFQFLTILNFTIITGHMP